MVNMVNTKMEKNTETLEVVRVTIKQMMTTELAAIMTAKANSFGLGIFFWEQELRKWPTTEMADTKMEKT